MAEALFTIGAAVRCSDGPCGKVTHVVVDPVARALTHVVVEPEHRSGLGRLMPLGLVEQESGGQLLLHCSRTAIFDTFQAAEETDFLPGGSGYGDYAAHEAYYWPYFGIEAGDDPSVTYASGVVTHDVLLPVKWESAEANPSMPPTVRWARSRVWSLAPRVDT